MMVPRRMGLADRLEHYSIPEPNSGCLLWMAKCTAAGHPVIKWRGKNRMAHRMAWAEKRGEAGHLCVLHKCDVPSCINVDHLFLGTTQDNTADKMRKGRHRSPRGSAHGMSKLTEDQVLAIRRDDRDLDIIASEYDVCRESVWFIQRRRTWRHI